MPRYQVDQDKYDRLTAEFRKTPGNSSEASRKVGISDKTAQVAWEKGYPSRGLRPIRSILEDEQLAARAKMEEEAVVRRKAQDDAAHVRKREGEVIRADFEVAAMATKAIFELWKGVTGLGEYVQQKVLVAVMAGSMSVQEAMRLLRESARLFRELSEALERLMRAERLHYGEPTAILGIQATDETLRFLRYVEEMTPEELEEAARTGRLPDRLDAVGTGLPN